MSKLSDGILLTPMKGVELIRQQKESEPVARYVAPSKRGAEEKVIKPLTAEQLDSQVSFPSLPSIKPMTKNISWGELRSRLTAPTTPEPETSMKTVIEESIKKEELAQEQEQRNEAITDPFLMKPEQRARHGWEVLKLSKASWFSRKIPNDEEQPYAWPAPVLSFHVDKTQNLIHKTEHNPLSYRELPW